MLNPIAVTALLLTFFFIAANKEYLRKRRIILRYIDSACAQLYCVEFSFKSIFLSIMQENKRGCFFVKHGVKVRKSK